jgi:hypothetical protein
VFADDHQVVAITTTAAIILISVNAIAMINLMRTLCRVCMGGGFSRHSAG